MPRLATPDDAEAIARLAARTFPLACPPTTTQENIEAHIRGELNVERFREQMATATFLVVDAGDGEVCGYAMIATEPPPIDHDWRNPAELRRIYVDADQHGQGVAASLMRMSLELAAQAGHDWLWLGTNMDNARALRFYEKSGFRIVGERTFRVGPSVESDYVLARPVP